MILVSVCIPCYNAAQFLTQTLEALLNQGHNNLEVIIINDHSTDGSEKIISELAAKDNRIIYKTATKNGASAARNQAYTLSRGKYIIFFDADDWISQNFIESQLKYLKSENDVVVASWGRFYHNDLSTINIDNSQIARDLSFEEWVSHYWINATHMTCPGRVLVSRDVIEKSGLWDEDLSLNDDFSFYTRIFSNAAFIRYNATEIFYYRSGINGLSSKKGSFAYHSLYNSLERSIRVAKFKLDEQKRLNLCYANLLQNFIYETYPYENKLIYKATQSIYLLGGSNLPFPAGGITKLLVALIGWKLTKKLKLYFKIFN